MSNYYPQQQQQQQQQQPQRDSRNTAYAELFSRPSAPSYPSARNTPPPGPSNATINNANSQPPYRQPQPGQRSSSAGSFRSQIGPGGGGGGGGGDMGGGAAGQRSSYYPPSSESPYSPYQQQSTYQDSTNPSRQLQYSSSYQQYQSPDLYQGSWQQQQPPPPQQPPDRYSRAFPPDGPTDYSFDPSASRNNYSSPRSSYAPTLASGPSNASTSSLYSRTSGTPATSLQHQYSTAPQRKNGSPVSLSPSVSSAHLPCSSSPPRLPEFTPASDDFYGFESSRPLDARDSAEWSAYHPDGGGALPGGGQRSSVNSLYGSGVIEEADGFDQHGPSSTSLYQYYDQPQYGGPHDLSRRHSGESDQFSLYRGNTSHDPRPLLPLNPSLMSVSTAAHPYPYHPNASPSPSTYATSLHSRRSSESVRVLPTQPKATHPQDRAFSFSSSSERPNSGSTPTPASVNGAAVVPRRAPVVYPALLSRVAEAFKSRITVNERVKDGLVYSDTFDGRDAVDKIAYIIKTTDRNLALLLGRALDAQKFFHDVTYDHRLRDSPLELYQFKERLSGAFLSSDDLTPVGDEYAAAGRAAAAARAGSTTDTVASDESTFPSGVFTLLTDCYSPTCTRDRLCYSIACPRRLEQQARLNLKPKPGLQRSLSSESLGDLREPGSLWIHSVPQDVADSTSESEKKRQEALNEVFYTERDFVRDMEYLRDSWIKPLRTLDIIPEARREDFVTQVFWNVLEIHAVNVRLADLLNKRQKQAHVVDKVGDIFLELVPHFGPFVKYGAHQLYGKYEFEKEKGSNPAFAKFVDETERMPESRKLELNGYLTKPTTRLARYPLLLEACLKNTPDDNPDKIILPKVVKLVREFLHKVNIETGRSENRFNLAQLDQQLVFKNGEAVDLRLRDEERDMIYKGPLKKRGGTQSESAELQVFLFDHAILMVKQKSKNEQYKVYRKPIPLELLVVAPIDDSGSARAGAVRPKSLMSRGSNARYLANPPPGIDKNSKQGFAMTFVHLGRRGYQITLWSASWAGRKKWLEKIEGRQQELRERSLVFETLPLSTGYFVGTNRVTCAAPFDNGNRIVYGTDNGVYLSDLRNKNKVPVKVISVPNVTQLDVLEGQGILIVLADKAVQTFFVDNLDPGDAVGAAKRARKISSHATFFKAGQCLGRTLVCVVKSGSVSSTIKTLEPIDQARGKKQPAIRKFLQGSNESLRVFKEFYIPTESSSVHFLKSKLCVGCTKGFEIVDLETLDTQGLLDPADSSLDFVQKRETARPIAIYRIEGEFLLCYDEFAFYVNKNGWRAKSNWIIQWEGFPTSFALHYPYVLAFEPTFVEVRHVESGALMQIIPGNNLRCLFADTPPSISSSTPGGSFFPPSTSHYGYANPAAAHPVSRFLSATTRSEIILADDGRVFSLQTSLGVGG